MKISALLTLCAFGLTSVAGVSPALAQTQNPPPPAKKEDPRPKPKAKKVWGNEDAADLRKPSDEYADQKAREADQAAAAGASAARPAGTPGAPGAAPVAAAVAAAPAVESTAPKRETLEELEELLELKEEVVKNESGLIEGLRLKIEESTERAEQMKMEDEIVVKQKLVQEAQQEVITVRDRVNALKRQQVEDARKAAAPKPATPPPPPPSF